MQIKIFSLHPIPYLSPIFDEISYLNTNTKIYYLDNLGIKKLHNQQYGKIFGYEKSIIKNHKYFFLKNVNENTFSGFFSRINLSVFKIIKKNDIVIIHGYSVLTNWLIIFFRYFKKFNILFKGETINTNRSFLNKIFIKFFFLKIDYFLYSCHGNLDFYKYMGIKKNKLISTPCTVDYDFFLKQNYKKNSKSFLNNEINTKFYKKKKILFMSKLINRKNPIEIVKAISLLKNKYDILLLIAGDGPLKKDIESNAKKYGVSTFFFGLLPYEKIHIAFHSADLYVNTSIYDASPKTLNEALCFDIPIIAPNKSVGNARDVIIENKNGFLYSVGNESDLSKKIELSFLLKKQIIISTNRKIIKDTHANVSAKNIMNSLNNGI